MSIKIEVLSIKTELLCIKILEFKYWNFSNNTCSLIYVESFQNDFRFYKLYQD